MTATFLRGFNKLRVPEPLSTLYTFLMFRNFYFSFGVYFGGMTTGGLAWSGLTFTTNWECDYYLRLFSKLKPFWCWLLSIECRACGNSYLLAVICFACFWLLYLRTSFEFDIRSVFILKSWIDRPRLSIIWTLSYVFVSSHKIFLSPLTGKVSSRVLCDKWIRVLFFL